MPVHEKAAQPDYFSLDERLLALLTENYGLRAADAFFPVLLDGDTATLLEVRSATSRKALVTDELGTWFVKQVPWYADDDRQLRFGHVVTSRLARDTGLVPWVRPTVSGAGWLRLPTGEAYVLSEYRPGLRYRRRSAQLASAGEALARLHECVTPRDEGEDYRVLVADHLDLATRVARPGAENVLALLRTWRDRMRGLLPDELHAPVSVCTRRRRRCAVRRRLLRCRSGTYRRRAGGGARRGDGCALRVGRSRRAPRRGGRHRSDRAVRAGADLRRLRCRGDGRGCVTARSDVGHVVLVAGGKGGVGKTTVAAGLAFRLALTGVRVGLVDADVSGPSVAALLRLAGPVPVYGGFMRPPVVGDGAAEVSVLSSGLFGEADKAFTWKGPLLRGVLRQFLRDADWGSPDILVVDTPPGTGETHTIVMDEFTPDATVLVTTPQPLAVADTRRSEAFFDSVAPVVAVVENLAEVVCEHCGRETGAVAGDRQDWRVPVFRLPAVFGAALPWRCSDHMRVELDRLARHVLPDATALNSPHRISEHQVE